MEGINSCALLILHKRLLYMFALFQFFRASRPVCMTVGSPMLYDSFCWAVSMVSSNARFLFDFVCRCTEYLWFTACCLRHYVFTESCVILEGDRGDKISQIVVECSADVSDLFLVFSSLLSPNTRFLSVSLPGVTNRSFNIRFSLSLLLKREKI